MIEFKKFTSITLNGQKLSGSEIISFCKDFKDGSLLPVASFMENWLNAEPMLTLKTSGSTGIPKTILAEKNKMLFSASITAQYFNFKPGQTALLCLPVDYIAGKMMIVRALYSGLNLLCFPPNKNPLLSLPEGVAIGFAAMVPMQLQQIILSKNKGSLKQIKKLLLGGGALGIALENETKKLPTEIFHGYGMTETLSHIALRHVNGIHASAEFTALDGIQLSQNEQDCLVVQAVGLLNEPIITNDVVHFTGINKFIWEGRIDNVINSGGIKLMPELLEKKLASLLNRRFYFTGVADEELGERLILIIEGNPFNMEMATSFKVKISRLLKKYEIPKNIYFVARFTETESSKINRPETTKSLFK